MPNTSLALALGTGVIGFALGALFQRKAAAKANAPAAAEAKQSPSDRTKDMTLEEFKQYGHEMINYIADYRRRVNDPNFPESVRSKVEAGYLSKLLPTEAPEKGQAWEDIVKDLTRAIEPGLTHWESPNFFAYFKPYAAFPSVLGDLLIAGYNAMGFSWIASPACTELETITLDWLGQMLGLPETFLSTNGVGGGVIQGSAGEAAIVALIAAKHKALYGLSGEARQTKLSKLTMYVSDQTHSILEKACKVVGLNKSQFRTVRTTAASDYGLTLDSVKQLVEEDRKNGSEPFFLCLTMGTTSSTAMDPIHLIAPYAKEAGLWVHVDAAYGGAFAVCPEFRTYLQGLDLVDSIGVNAHKALMVTFDCACLWVQDRRWLVSALTLTPENEEYLRNKATSSGKVIDYKDWQIPLGRRFRALKLFFVLRYFGAEGLRAHIRAKVSHAATLEARIRSDARFELVVPRTLSLVCFRAIKAQADGPAYTDVKEANAANQKLLDALCDSGKIFLVHTVLEGRQVLRLACGGLEQTDASIEQAWRLIQSTADKALLA